MAATRQNPPSATNAERVESNSAGDLKLASHSTSHASPETAVQLSRIETILDRIVGSLERSLLAGAQ
jgi:hypothetical protein